LFRAAHVPVVKLTGGLFDMEQNDNNLIGGEHSLQDSQLLSQERPNSDIPDERIGRDGIGKELHERQGREASPNQGLANVYHDPRHCTVTFLLDETIANTVIYAVRMLAAESEAHAREVRVVAATLPPDSYGAANRHKIASRHERVAARLRRLETNYRDIVSEHREQS